MNLMNLWLWLWEHVSLNQLIVLEFRCFVSSSLARIWFRQELYCFLVSIFLINNVNLIKLMGVCGLQSSEIYWVFWGWSRVLVLVDSLGNFLLLKLDHLNQQFLGMIEILSAFFPIAKFHGPKFPPNIQIKKL
jgi:hypothetical protein